jgi:prevent-host-death family protein
MGMTIVTIHEAKTNLSRLIKLVEAGEEVVIARGEKPVARLTLIEASPKKSRNLGYGSFTELKGKIPNSAFFDPLSQDDLKLWEGGE